jgi:ElaB/YqjD/DUF883 family membrane-anchored ribosome-binding protein
MENSAKNVSNPVAKLAIAAEQAASGAFHASDQLSDADRSAVRRTAASAHRIVDRLSGASERVAQRLEYTAVRLKDAEQHLVGASSSYVREHPLKTAGVALAAGFLISHLISAGKSAGGSAE